MRPRRRGRVGDEQAPARARRSYGIARALPAHPGCGRRRRRGGRPGQRDRHQGACGANNNTTARSPPPDGGGAGGVSPHHDVAPVSAPDGARFGSSRPPRTPMVQHLSAMRADAPNPARRPARRVAPRRAQRGTDHPCAQRGAASRSPGPGQAHAASGTVTGPRSRRRLSTGEPGGNAEVLLSPHRTRRRRRCDGARRPDPVTSARVLVVPERADHRRPDGRERPATGLEVALDYAGRRQHPHGTRSRTPPEGRVPGCALTSASGRMIGAAA
jgi:hypothetical protein